MRDRFVDERNLHEVLFCLTERFLNRHRDVSALGDTKANAATAIADNHSGSEAHALAAFRHTSNTSELENLLLEFTRFTIVSASAAAFAAIATTTTTITAATLTTKGRTSSTRWATIRDS